MGLTNDLRYRLTAYGKQPIETATGETDYDYLPIGTVWGAITVTGGRAEPLPGDSERVEITHKITLRAGAVKPVADLYFVCQGQKYEVQYWQPHYKKRDRIEFLCKLVVEDGA